MGQSTNNGNFLLTGVATQNSVLAAVLDKDLDTAPIAPSIGDRYIIAPTANTVINPNDVLDKDLDTPPGSPSVTDRYIIAAGANNVKLDPVLDVLPSSSLATTTHNFRYLIERSGINSQGTVNSIENDDTGLDDSVGQRYLVGPFPVNGFAGQANNIAEGTGAGFTFVVPSANDEVLVTAGALTYYFDGSTWEINEWASNPNQIAQYNGVGTPGWTYITPNDDDVVDDLDSGEIYQFDNGSGTWSINPWGGSAGRIAEWNGSAWIFTIPLDDEVRNVIDEAERYQYDLGTNVWTLNPWGGEATKIAEWSGAVWNFTTPATNDVSTVTDESQDYIFNGTAWEIFQFWIEITNINGVVETGASGTGLVGQRRQISDYVSTSGAITLTSALRATPSPTDEFILLPSTKENVVDFFNNTRVTSLSGRADIELVDQANQIQISSKLDGSDGFVQITGGQANNQLGFSTTLVQGLRAYAFYVGLIKLVHRTVYGDEQDLVAFPGVGAAGVKFQILPPTVQQVSFSVEVTLSEGTSLSNVENNVKTAISTYVKTLGVAQPVIISNVVEAVLAVDGVIDVSVTTPTANVAISENELARTKASLIVVEQS